MDEIIFRGSQRLESLQVQFGMATSQGKELLEQYSEQSKHALGQMWGSTRSIEIREAFKDVWIYILTIAKQTKHYLITVLEPKSLIMGFHKIFGEEWTHRNIYFGCAGLVVGGFLGFCIGLAMRKAAATTSHMQAVQCAGYTGIEAAIVVEDAIVPTRCASNEVVVQVRAASVQAVDARICQGYGRRLRWLLGPYFQNKHDLPVTLGRDCTGIVTDIGQQVKRLEIGDEVWLTTPFWAPGTMCQTVIVPEHRVSRKPKHSGFEAACSLPYAGSVALSVLKRAGINADTGLGKRVLIQDGCTPVGCILIQVLKLWSVDITTTCSKRAVPVARALGANDIIVLTDVGQSKEDLNSEYNVRPVDVLRKELEFRDPFDVIINTRLSNMREEELKKYCTSGGYVLLTVENNLRSDSCGSISAIVFWSYVRLKRLLQRLSGQNLENFGEPHMCHMSLDELCNLVEEGLLQTVVERVYHPQEIEKALTHIQSNESIGSCVITFRNRPACYDNLPNPNSYWTIVTSLGATQKVLTAKNAVHTIEFKKRQGFVTR